MIKRRFYKLEHGDKDSGSDSSCFSSDSDPEPEEESESEDSIAEVFEDEDDDSVSEREGQYESSSAGIQSEDDDANVDDDDDDDDKSDGDDYGGRLKKTLMNRKPDLEEPPEEVEENYILGCMIKRKSVYRCRYCPHALCLNEKTMQEHVSSKKHARMERLMKEGTDDDEVDDPEIASQEKQTKGNRRSQRQGKRSQKQGNVKVTDDEEVDNPETPSQEKQTRGNRKSRRQLMRSQKQEKGSSITQGKDRDSTEKSIKKRRRTKD